MAKPEIGTLWTRDDRDVIVCGLPKMKDDTDANWHKAVAYHDATDDEPDDDLGNVKVRKVDDFLAKFEEVMKED